MKDLKIKKLSPGNGNQWILYFDREMREALGIDREWRYVMCKIENGRIIIEKLQKS